ncbi:MAG: S41 family peptidase, partial [Roseburia sp.]|nr:S41 family peptidase [Roseburia sp.]
HLRGPKNTVAKLLIRRQGEDITFNVVRDDIPIYSVDETFMADPTTGYIRVTRFAEDTANEVAIAIDKLRRQGMQNLIIDLSDNTGGYLGSAFDLAGQFLPAGTPVVSTSGRAVRDHQYTTTTEGNFQNGRVVVIANQYSASASEIFSGAMQDNDRGLIVGRRTFGKGLVQRPFPFPDGSMMRLTISRYYTPSGRCIQKHYDKGHTEDYQREVYLRMSAGELWSADSIARPDSLLFHTLNNHRPVYGGGGIIPDVFVPADTSYYSKYYRDIVAKNVLNRAVINYVEANRADLLHRYSNNDKYYTGFEVPQSLLDNLIALATAEDIEFDQEQWTRSQPLIKAILKGLISRDLYESGSYYRAIAPLNRDFNAALELINDPERYNALLRGEVR